jgi:hypothetical protein
MMEASSGGRREGPPPPLPPPSRPRQSSYLDVIDAPRYASCAPHAYLCGVWRVCVCVCVCGVWWVCVCVCMHANSMAWL